MTTLNFRQLVQDGKPTTAQSGDRVVYDERNGTLFVFRSSGEIMFIVADGEAPIPRLFVGRDWTRGMTKGAAEYYARLGGLSGAVAALEGSFATLHTYEVLP